MKLNSKTLGLAIALASAPSLSPLGAWADQRPAAPLPLVKDSVSGTFNLSGKLENDLQDMMQSCLGSRLQAVRKAVIGHDTYAEVSVLPSMLKTSLHLNDSPATDRIVFPQSDGDLTLLFGVVFFDKTAFVMDNRAGTTLLAQNYSDSDDMNVAPGYSTVSYLSTCSLSLNAALKATGDYAIPVASVQASITAGYDSASSYDLTLVDGVFESPVEAMYSRRNADPDLADAGQLYASLVFWDWYAQNRNRIGQENYILKDFRGLAIYKRGGLKQSTSFALNLGGSFQVPGASLTSSTAGKFGATSSLSLASYESFSDVDANKKPIRESYTLPQPAQISGSLQNLGHITIVNDPTVDFSILDLTPKEFKEEVRFLPSQHCTSSYWTTNDNRLSVTDALKVSRDRGLTGCIFTVQYQPTAIDLAGPTSLNLAFDLVARTNLGTPAIPITLNLHAAPLALRVLKIPVIHFISGSPEPTVLSSTPMETVLQWTFNYSLNDNGRVVTAADMNLDNLQLDCKGAPVPAYPRLDASFAANQTGNTKAATVTATVHYPGKLPPALAGLNYQSCTIEGTVLYSLKGMVAPVERAFQDTEMRYPQPATPAPNLGVAATPPASAASPPH